MFLAVVFLSERTLLSLSLRMTFLTAMINFGPLGHWINLLTWLGFLNASLGKGEDRP